MIINSIQKQPVTIRVNKSVKKSLVFRGKCPNLRLKSTNSYDKDAYDFAAGEAIDARRVFPVAQAIIPKPAMAQSQPKTSPWAV